MFSPNSNAFYFGEMMLPLMDSIDQAQMHDEGPQSQPRSVQERIPLDTLLSNIDELHQKENKRISQAVEGSPGFLRLPLEIRWVIYRQLLRSDSGVLILPPYGVRGSRTIVDGIGLLSVNKQIHQEALYILGEENECWVKTDFNKPAQTTAMMHLQCVSIELSQRSASSFSESIKFPMNDFKWKSILSALTSNSNLKRVKFSLHCLPRTMLSFFGICKHVGTESEKAEKELLYKSLRAGWLATSAQYLETLVSSRLNDSSSLTYNNAVTVTFDSNHFPDVGQGVETHFFFAGILAVKDNKLKRMGCLESLSCIAPRWHEQEYDEEIDIKTFWDMFCAKQLEQGKKWLW